MKLWFVTLSVVAHAGTGAAVFVTGTWDIERLDREQRPLAVLTMNLPAPAPAGGSIQLPEVNLEPKPKPVAVDLHQLVVRPETPTSRPSPAGGGQTGTGTGTDPEGTGECKVPPCRDAPVLDLRDQPPLPPAPPKPPDDPIILPPNTLALQRESGETQIQAPGAVKLAMRDDGRDRVIGVIYVCASEGGAVTSVTLKKSTKYPAYDEKLVQAARAWRFRPYASHGRIVKICGTTTFVYSLK